VVRQTRLLWAPLDGGGTLVTTGVAAVGAWVGVRQRRLDRQRPDWQDFTQDWKNFRGIGANDGRGGVVDYVYW